MQDNTEGKSVVTKQLPGLSNILLRAMFPGVLETIGIDCVGCSIFLS